MQESLALGNRRTWADSVFLSCRVRSLHPFHTRSVTPDSSLFSTALLGPWCSQDHAPHGHHPARAAAAAEEPPKHTGITQERLRPSMFLFRTPSLHSCFLP
jgi:hypothetical protein